MSKYRYLSIISFVLIILISLSGTNLPYFENSGVKHENRQIQEVLKSTQVENMNGSKTNINIDNQLWDKNTIIPSGDYINDIDAIDAVFDGSVYHVVFSTGVIINMESNLEYVYYTSYSGSAWSKPIVIFDGSQGDFYNRNFTYIESIALEYSASKSTFYLAINAYWDIGHTRVSYIESKSTLTNVTIDAFDTFITGDTYHLPKNIRLALYQDTIVLGYEVWESFNGARPYTVEKDSSVTSSFSAPILVANNTFTVYGDLFFGDIMYSVSRSKFLLSIRNSSKVIGEQLQIFESSDGKSWIENTSFSNIPTNPDGFSTFSFDEYNNELYATYSIVGDELDKEGQFNDLVITRTSGGVFLPYVELIDSRASLQIYPMSKTMFVSGNIIVISIIRPDAVSNCNCESNILKMYTRTGIDIQSPPFTTLTSPSDKTILNNQTLLLTWPINSGEFGYYNIYKDGVKLKLGTNDYWGSWHDGTKINYTDTARLPVGIYNFTIAVYDIQGNIILDTIWVSSTIAPLAIKSNRETGSVFVGDSLPIVYWYIYGGLDGSYKIYKNGSIIDDQIFTYDQVKYNKYVSLSDGSILIVGVYNYTIRVTDSSGSVKMNTVMITIKNHSPLTLSSPADETYFNSENISISWKVTGEAYQYYQLTFLVSTNKSYTHSPVSGYWTDGETIKVVDGPMAIGVYNYTIYVTNNTHSIEDTVIITIIPNTLPILSTPSDQTIQTNTELEVIWKIDSSSSGTYSILKNGTEVFNDIWLGKDTIRLYYSKLDADSYNFTIVVFEQSGIKLTDTVIVIVLEPVQPTITSPSDITLFTNQTIKLDWSISSVDSGNFEVFKNKVSFKSGTWKDGDMITINDGPLKKGTYNYTIEVSTTNFSLSYTVIVTIIDIPANTSISSTTSSTSDIISSTTSSKIISTTSTTSTASTTDTSVEEASFFIEFVFIVISMQFIAILLRTKRK